MSKDKTVNLSMRRREKEILPILILTNTLNISHGFTYVHKIGREIHIHLEPFSLMVKLAQLSSALPLMVPTALIYFVKPTGFNILYYLRFVELEHHSWSIWKQLGKQCYEKDGPSSSAIQSREGNRQQDPSQPGSWNKRRRAYGKNNLIVPWFIKPIAS